MYEVGRIQLLYRQLALIKHRLNAMEYGEQVWQMLRQKVNILRWTSTKNYGVAKAIF